MEGLILPSLAGLGLHPSSSQYLCAGLDSGAPAALASSATAISFALPTPCFLLAASSSKFL